MYLDVLDRATCKHINDVDQVGTSPDSIFRI
jgi:hypothetical protein